MKSSYHFHKWRKRNFVCLWRNRPVRYYGKQEIFQRVWDSSEQAKSVRQALWRRRSDLRKGYSFPMLAPKLVFLWWRNLMADVSIKGCFALRITAIIFPLQVYRRVVIPNNLNCHFSRAESSKHITNNRVQFVNFKLYILHENIIINAIFYNLSVNLNVFHMPFRSLPFWRLYCFPIKGRGKDRKGKKWVFC